MLGYKKMKVLKVSKYKPNDSLKSPLNIKGLNQKDDSPLNQWYILYENLNIRVK